MAEDQSSGVRYAKMKAARVGRAMLPPAVLTRVAPTPATKPANLIPAPKPAAVTSSDRLSGRKSAALKIFQEQNESKEKNIEIQVEVQKQRTAMERYSKEGGNPPLTLSSQEDFGRKKFKVPAPPPPPALLKKQPPVASRDLSEEAARRDRFPPKSSSNIYKGKKPLLNSASSAPESANSPIINRLNPDSAKTLESSFKNFNATGENVGGLISGLLSGIRKKSITPRKTVVVEEALSENQSDRSIFLSADNLKDESQVTKMRSADSIPPPPSSSAIFGRPPLASTAMSPKSTSHEALFTDSSIYMASSNQISKPDIPKVKPLLSSKSALAGQKPASPIVRVKPPIAPKPNAKVTVESTPAMIAPALKSTLKEEKGLASLSIVKVNEKLQADSKTNFVISKEKENRKEKTEQTSKPKVDDDSEGHQKLDIPRSVQIFIFELFKKAIAENSLEINLFEDFTLSSIGVSAYYRFMDVFSYFNTVTSISLRYCNIGDDFAQALYEYMSDRRYPFMEVLNLEGNNFSLEGLVAILATLDIGYGEDANGQDPLDENGIPVPFQCAIVDLNLLNQKIVLEEEETNQFEQYVLDIFTRNSSILRFSYIFSDQDMEKAVRKTMVRNAAFIRIALEEEEKSNVSEQQQRESLYQFSLPAIPSELSFHDLDVIEMTSTLQSIIQVVESGMEMERKLIEFIDEPDFRESSNPELYQKYAFMIGSGRALTTVRLIAVDLSDDFLKSYVDGMKSRSSDLPCVENLCLDYNKLTGHAIILLFRVLESTPSLKEVSIIGQDPKPVFTAAQEEELLSSIENNKSLLGIKLDFNNHDSARRALRVTKRNRSVE